MVNNFTWKRKGNNHELFVDEKKVGTISGRLIKQGRIRDYYFDTLCDCDACMRTPDIIVYNSYYFGKKIKTYTNSLRKAKKELEQFVKESHA